MTHIFKSKDTKFFLFTKLSIKKMFFFSFQLHFHKSESETLYQHVPKDLLPAEYGGKAGEVKTIKSNFKKVFDSFR